jgi:hypothetical protein
MIALNLADLTASDWRQLRTLKRAFDNPKIPSASWDRESCDRLVSFGLAQKFEALPGVDVVAITPEGIRAHESSEALTYQATDPQATMSSKAPRRDRYTSGYDTSDDAKVQEKIAAAAAEIAKGITEPTAAPGAVHYKDPRWIS